VIKAYLGEEDADELQADESHAKEALPPEARR
jgi:hypothetical protein